MRTKDFWDRVRSLANEKHVSQAVVAEAGGIPYSTLRKWLSKNTIPPLDVASALAVYFGVSLDYLTFGKKPDPGKIKEFLLLIKETDKKIGEIGKYL